MKATVEKRQKPKEHVFCRVRGGICSRFMISPFIEEVVNFSEIDVIHCNKVVFVHSDFILFR